ncbi:MULTISPECIES: hypothetical protein [Sphingomonas]|uniref:hypothetical protein n=1 Tax=Sphingomonas TaxID=13687 RepID=UPI001455A8D1|nr:hypothetical protein [Sphingomonas olei]
MPKKQSPEAPEDQSERFVREAQKLIDAGELSPTDADEGFERAMQRIASGRRGPEDR